MSDQTGTMVHDATGVDPLPDASSRGSRQMPLPQQRGPVSALLCGLLAGTDPEASRQRLVEAASLAAAQTPDVLFDEDLQLALFVCYELHYRGFDGVDDTWEWDPDVLRARAELERVFEDRLRAAIDPVYETATTAQEVSDALFALAEGGDGPSVADFVLRHATTDQVREVMAHKSVYQLKEADPHTWAIPRLEGRAKSALVEIQMDEYGNGRPGRMHSELFARTMNGLGLDHRFGAHIEHVPAISLASVNLMSLFGLHRRLRGAVLGHLAIYEMTSSLPSSQYSRGLRRLGFGDDVAGYFDEHVEADAVHEQIAGRDMAGGLIEADPSMREQVFFGAAAVCLVDGLLGAWQLGAWEQGRSSLRMPLEAEGMDHGA